MADPKMLYAVVAVVFAGLAVWLAFVFRTAKEPWARAAAPAQAKPEEKPTAAEAEDEDDEEEDEDDDPEGEKVTVKDEAATEEAIEKAKAEQS